eukprot:141581-Alexandrium_andersonii.AAC.1
MLLGLSWGGSAQYKGTSTACATARSSVAISAQGSSECALRNCHAFSTSTESAIVSKSAQH